jgi:peroxiredoxin
MRKATIILILGFILPEGIAQIPDNPEDISPLLISEKIPDINLQSLQGESIPLTGKLVEKRSVLLFYRGGWCPYCNAHLSAVGEVEEDILALGYQVIAISPDSPGKLRTTAEKEKLKYTLYSDASGDLMTAMGIAFKAPDRYEKRLANYSDGQNPGILPVPSLFVVETDGTIMFEYINPDYKHRISADLLISVLRNLSN